MPVAGPGSVLFFRYQLFIMVWALVIAGLWAFGLQCVKVPNGNSVLYYFVLYCVTGVRMCLSFQILCPWLRWPSFPQVTALCILSEPKILNLHESFVQ